MLRNGILQDSFGMLSFLRLIGLHINGSSMNFQWAGRRHNMWSFIPESAIIPRWDLRVRIICVEVSRWGMCLGLRSAFKLPKTDK